MEWHRTVGFIICFVSSLFLLFATKNYVQLFCEWTLFELCLLWQAGDYLLSSSYYDVVCVNVLSTLMNSVNFKT